MDVFPAREVDGLKTQQRGLLHVDQELLLLVDSIVACAKLLTDNSDARPWHERLGSYFEGLGDAQDIEAYLNTLVERMPDFTNSVPTWARSRRARKVSRASGRRH